MLASELVPFVAVIIDAGISLEFHRKNKPRTDTEDRCIGTNYRKANQIIWQNFFKSWNAGFDGYIL